MSASRPDWSRVRHVLLDMDGTVLDLAFDNFLWREAVPTHYAQARGMSVDTAKAVLGPRFMAVAHTLAWYDLDYWSEATGLDLSAMHDQYRDRIRMLDRTIEFLDAVRDSGRSLWLTTNAHPGSWQPKLRQAGIRHYFGQVFSSHDAQAPKEDAAYWSSLQQRHPFNLDEALFADDSEPVLASARAFGIGQIVAMCAPDTTQPQREREGFYNVARLNELLPVG